MEMMDTSMDKLYQLVYKTLGQQIPERIIGKINASVSLVVTYSEKNPISTFSHYRLSMRFSISKIH